jgi:hypothetical protein
MEENWLKKLYRENEFKIPESIPGIPSHGLQMTLFAWPWHPL